MERISHFEKGRNCRESLLDTVASFDVRNFFSVLATPLYKPDKRSKQMCQNVSFWGFITNVQMPPLTPMRTYLVGLDIYCLV